jgi:hypothetical protein
MLEEHYSIGGRCAVCKSAESFKHTHLLLHFRLLILMDLISTSVKLGL